MFNRLLRFFRSCLFLSSLASAEIALNVIHDQQVESWKAEAKRRSDIKRAQAAEKRAARELAEAQRVAFLKSMFYQVYTRDSGRCWLCGCRVPHWTTLTDADTLTKGTLDHIIPVSKGGPDSLPNLRLAHQHCNEVRDTLPPKEGWIKLKDFAAKLDPTLKAYSYAPASFYKPNPVQEKMRRAA